MSKTIDIPEGFDVKKLYRPKEIALFWPYSVSCLANLRNSPPRGKPRPKVHRVGVRKVVYLGSDFIDFVRRDLRELDHGN